MALKYRFNLKDIKLEDFKVYLVAMFKGILPKKKIKNIFGLDKMDVNGTVIGDGSEGDGKLDLSPNLISESIQFNMKSNDVIINSISKQANFLGNSYNNIQVNFIRDSIERINDSIRLKNVNLEVYNQEKDLLGILKLLLIMEITCERESRVICLETSVRGT